MKEYMYWLCNIEKIGAVKSRRLLESFGDAKTVFLASEKALQESGILYKKELDSLLQSKRNFLKLENEYHKLQDKGIRFITAIDKEYPKRLKNIYDPPQGLYILGELPKDEVPSVAIVGARNCSHYGASIATQAASALAKAGIEVISGMASGIDAFAHRGTLEALGKTFAVLGSGVDYCYPIENYPLYEQMKSCGGILSEFPIGSKPIASHFPQRNRIISALADVILVVEARTKSGSLITADQALEQGKEVYAVPGRLDDSLSTGCNQLIKQGAEVYLKPENLLDFFHFSSDKKENFYKKEELRLALEEEKVYSELGLYPKSLAEIVEISGLEPSKVVKILLRLELSDLIEQTEKNFYAVKIR